MRPQHYRASDLIDLFMSQKFAVMAELKEALGTRSSATVFRRLAELSYRTSYSNRGKYYTLDSIADYNEWGLWGYRSVFFSQYGTLIATAEALVGGSEAGFFVPELESLLHVEVKGALLKLVRQQRLARIKARGRYLYCSPDPSRQRQQLLARRLVEAQPTMSGGLVYDDIMPDELKVAIVLFFSLLDERQRRLYAGLESLKLGHGGDRRLADVLGLDPATVARGRRELLSREVASDRVRSKGGGRKPVEKKPRKSSPESGS